MIDDSDGDTFWILGIFSSGWSALILLVFAVIFWIVAAQNKEECSHQTCLPGMTAKLLNHECLCVAVPLTKP